MTNFEFHEVFSLLGEKENHPYFRRFWECIQKDYKNSFIIHQPEKEDIKSDNDNWKCYDGSLDLGIVIEVLNGTVICVSFSRGGTFYNQPQEIHAYPYPLYNGLRLGSGRETIRAEFGDPMKEGDFFDQYQINVDIRLGIIYNLQDNKADIVSYGVNKFFSKPAKTPSRFSFTFISLN